MKKRWKKGIAIVLFTAVVLTSAVPFSTAGAAGKNEIPTTSDMSKNNFVLIKGGSFQMGSPKKENWRSKDEKRHSVTVSDFYMSAYEVTQAEYKKIMKKNPSRFSGKNLPVETVSWLDAVKYCNARSKKEGLTPAYKISGKKVTWKKKANGYRLPTEAEWEYACRAGTVTPFNTEHSVSAKEVNYYGDYPYEIEDYYFTEEKLETKPGVYREKTVSVKSFSPNAWGLYNMHGNVSEWVWDYYGTYGTKKKNPTGPKSGNYRVYRGGGWNDFAKHTRSAYRAAGRQEQAGFNVGIRLVRNAVKMNGTVGSSQKLTKGKTKGKILIAYFSEGGNTRGIAKEIKSQTGADIFEIKMKKPYSSDYDTLLNQTQKAQNTQSRPKLKNHVKNMKQYDIVLLGYPNWWASIPMPVASFLEEYNFKGKTVIPFCSNGGGKFGQTLTAVAKLLPNTMMGEGMTIEYDGGSSLPSRVKKWLKKNGIK